MQKHIGDSIVGALSAVAVLGASVFPARAEVVVVTVTAVQDCREVPVAVELPAGHKAGAWGGAVVPGQLEPGANGVARLTFVARDLKAGEKRVFGVETQPQPNAVELKRGGENVEFWVGGKLFTRYDTTTGPTKPYFYPLNAPTGEQLVRHWPVEKGKLAGETTDHPHHRGLWFTHGKVNGVDFWLETGKVGKTVHTAFETVQSGPVYGLMRAKTDWILPDGKKIAEDVREVRVYSLMSGTLLDFKVTLKPIGAPLVFGDTKEGTFALRMADSMRAAVEKGKTAEGRILNANGDRDSKAWGKSAAWCDFWGPVDGKTWGVAILDDVNNPRYPTTWHVRDYGLFAVNPFGLHDFDRKNAAGAGDLTVPLEGSVNFTYRVLIHPGSTEEAGVAQWARQFAMPPTVAVR